MSNHRLSLLACYLLFVVPATHLACVPENVEWIGAVRLKTLNKCPTVRETWRRFKNTPCLSVCLYFRLYNNNYFCTWNLKSLANLARVLAYLNANSRAAWV